MAAINLDRYDYQKCDFDDKILNLYFADIE